MTCSLQLLSVLKDIYMCIWIYFLLHLLLDKGYLDRSANRSLRLKIDLLKEFLDKVIPAMGECESIDEKLDEYMLKAKENEILDFAAKHNLNPNILKNLIYEQEFSGFIKTENIEKATAHLKFLEKYTPSPKIKDFVYEHIDKFSY